MSEQFLYTELRYICPRTGIEHMETSVAKRPRIKAAVSHDGCGLCTDHSLTLYVIALKYKKAPSSEDEDADLY